MNAAQPKLHISFDFAYMACKAQAMVNKSLDTLVNLNAKLSRKVIACGPAVMKLTQWIGRRAG